MNGFDTYSSALQEALNSKEQQVEDFSVEKGRKQAIDDAVSIFDIPSAEKLIEEGVKSEHTRYVLRQALRRFMGDEKADEIVDNIQNKGLKGLLDTDLKGVLKSRAEDSVEGDGSSLLGDLTKALSGGKEGLLNFIKNKSPSSLKDFKDSIFQEGEKQAQSLKELRDGKLSELREQFNDLKGNLENATGEEKDAIISKLNELKAQGNSIKADYKNQLEDLKTNTKSKLQDIQDEINNQAENLSDSAKDTMQEITGATDENIGSIGDVTSSDILGSLIPKATSKIVPEEFSDVDFIDKAKSALSNGFNTISGLFKGKVSKALEIKDNLSDRASSYLKEFNDRSNFELPKSLTNEIEAKKSLLADLKNRYETQAISREEAGDLQQQISELNNSIYDLEGKAADMTESITNNIKGNLLSKYGLNEDTLQQGLKQTQQKISGVMDEDLDINSLGDDIVPNVIKSAGNLITGQLQHLQTADLAQHIPGSDSTLARALNNAPKETSGSEAKNLAGEKVEEAQNPEATTPIQEEEAQAEPAKVSGEGVEDVVPESEQELAETGEDVGKDITKDATADLAEETGETAAEGVAEATGEAAAATGASSYLGPLALIVGLGTLIGQTIHNVKEAKEQANITPINPSFQSGV